MQVVLFLNLNTALSIQVDFTLLASFPPFEYLPFLII